MHLCALLYVTHTLVKKLGRVVLGLLLLEMKVKVSRDQVELSYFTDSKMPPM